MKKISDIRVVLITRRTRLDDLIARFHTIAQAKFYVEHLGADFSDYLHEHQQYRQALDLAKQHISRVAKLHVLDRTFLPNYIFSKTDRIVVLGPDGLVANTMKYLDDQPIIGVNPDKNRWDGVLLPFEADDLKTVLPEVLTDSRTSKYVTMASVSLKNGQHLLAVNDVFIGRKTHVSARYTITLGNHSEPQSSSGIIVSTGLGSTGWLTSILTGAAQIVNQLCSAEPENPLLKIPPTALTPHLTWDSEWLVFSVREPFPSISTKADMVFGTITKTQPLIVISEMGDHGVIFSDGIESDYIEFNSGMEAVISVSEKKGSIIV